MNRILLLRPFVLIPILLLFSILEASGQSAFRSAASGAWSDNTTWETAATSAGPWSAAGVGIFPGQNDTVYLEAGDSVYLTGNASVYDLHFNSTVDVQRFYADIFDLDIYGKIRIYTGAAPGSSLSGSAGVTGWINTGSGSLRFVGSTRYAVKGGEFGARIENAGITVEFALNSGDTAYIDETTRFGNVTVSSGVLRVGDAHTFRPTETTATASGNADGKLTILSGASMVGGRGIFKNGSNAIDSLIIEPGGRLTFTYVTPIIAAQVQVINGTLGLEGASQNFPAASSRFGATTVDTASHVLLGGTGSKTMINNFVILDTTEYALPAANLNKSTYTFNFDSDGGVLVYSDDAAQTTSNVEFPNDGSITGLVINNPAGVTLNGNKGVSGNLTMLSGRLFLGNFDLIMGTSATGNAGTPSSTAMVVSNGTGRLGKIFTTTGSFFYPIGTGYDSLNSTADFQYSPAEISFTSGIFTDDTVFVRASQNLYAGIDTTLDTLARYWEVDLPADLTGITYDGTFTYADADVIGTEASLTSISIEGGVTAYHALSNSGTNELSFTNATGDAIITAVNQCYLEDNTLTPPATIDFCDSGTPGVITGSVPTAGGVVSYQWQLNQDGGGFADISSANGQNYTPPTLSVSGVYEYRRIATSSACLGGENSISDTVTFTVETSPIAGTATDTRVCDTETVLDLNNTLSGADAGGTWLDDDATGALSGSTINPSSIAAGTYNFTYVVAGTICPNDSETVAITIEALPNAGTGTNPIICQTNTSFNLSSTISGGDAGGTWLDLDATGALLGSVFDASAVTPGDYNFAYLVAGTACPNDTTFIVATVEASPNAGTGSNTILCETSTSFDLNTLLTGADAGGTWLDNDATGALSGSTVNASVMVDGTYTFTYVVGGTSCPNDSTTVSIDRVSEVVIGSTTDPTVCVTSTAYDLNNALSGTTLGGTWTDDDASGALTGDIIDPSIMTPGTYAFTYTVSGCTTVNATISVTIEDIPNAGTGSNTTLCETSTSFDLNTLLTGADAGGTWLDDDATGALSGSLIDASAMVDGTFSFTYVVSGIACTNDSTTISIDRVSEVVIGSTTDPTVCVSSTSFDLNSTLSGTTLGGIWTDDDASGALTGDIIDPSIMTPGTYAFTYTVSGCTTANATISVTIEDIPNAGTGANVTLCETTSSFDLTSTLTGQDAGGTWLDTDATGALSGSLIDPSALAAGSYAFTYVVSGTACQNDSTSVSITVESVPGNNTITASATASCGVMSSLTLTGSTPTGGSGSYNFVWQRSVDGNDFSTLANTGQSLTQNNLPVGTYWYRRLVTSGSCSGADTSNIETIQVVDTLTNNNITAPPITTYCGSASGISINGTTPNGGGGGYIYTWQTRVNGGAWTTLSATTEDLTGLSLSSAGIHEVRRTVSTSICGTALVSNTVSITVDANDLVNTITAPTQLEYCGGNSGEITFDGAPGSGGNGTYNYTWLRSLNNGEFEGVGNGEDLSITLASSGTYRFFRQLGSATCFASSDTITVTVVAAITNNTITLDSNFICDGPATVTITGSNASGGTGTITYQWEASQNDGAFVVDAENTRESYSKSNVAVGRYEYRRIAISGNCTDTSDPASLLISAPIVVSLADLDSASLNDDGGKLVVQAQGGTAPYEFAWSNGATGPTLQNIASGAYTVNVTDINGCIGSGTFNIPQITGLPDDLFESWALYPNPATDRIIFTGSLREIGNTNLVLYNAQGIIVAQKEAHNQMGIHEEWDLSQLPAGMYMLLVNQDSQMVSFTIWKQ